MSTAREVLWAQYMTRALAAFLMLTPLVGCFAEPVGRGPTNNPEVQVDLLFTHDGCTVYRFRDVGFHYYVRCQDTAPGETVSTLACTGKGCTDGIRTLTYPAP
jgi:hypothetical protein